MLSKGTRLLLHFFVIVIGFFYLSLHSAADTLIGTGFVATVVYAYLAYAEAKSGIPLNPLSFHFAWYTAAYGLAPIYFGLRISHGVPTEFVITTIDPDNLAYAYLLGLIGSFVLHAVLQRMRPSGVVMDKGRGEVHWLLAFVIFILGIAAIVTPPELLFSGSLASILQYGPFAVLMLLAIRQDRPTYFWSKMLVGTALIIASTTVSFATSYKSFAMFAMLPLMIYLWRHHRRAMFGYGLVLAVLYLTVVAPTINKSRDFKTLDPVEKFTKAFDSYHLSDEDFFSRQWGGFLDRVFDPIEVGFIVADVDQNGFRHGETMDNLAYGLIPRIFWPDKPYVNRGFWFTTYIGFSQSEKERTTSTAMSNVGELYWNWGIPGVVIGIALIGILYGGLWRIATHLGLTTLKGMLLYFIVTITTINPSEASTTVLSAILLYLVVFAYWITRYVWTELISANMKAPGSPPASIMSHPH